MRQLQEKNHQVHVPEIDEQCDWWFKKQAKDISGKIILGRGIVMQMHLNSMDIIDTDKPQATYSYDDIAEDAQII